MGKCYLVRNKTVATPRRPYDRERMDRELQLIGKYGLKSKREVWRAQLALSLVRRKARSLLVLDEKAPKRIFEGAALIRRLTRYGIVQPGVKLDQLLSLSVEDFLKRRLQSLVTSAKSIHEARCQIRHGHIAVCGRPVNVPSFLVRVDNQGFIGHSPCSPFSATGRMGRRARKTFKANQ